MSKKDMLGGSALAHAAGPLKTLIDRLDGPNGESELEALKRFLRKENQRRKKIVPKFPIWKTIRIGGKTDDELLAELEAGGFEVDSEAKDMVTSPGFCPSHETRDINLARLTVRDLDYLDGHGLPLAVSRKAKELGLKLCPPEVGPHLRLAYTDQPNGEKLWIGMERMWAADCPSMFVLTHTDAGYHLNNGGTWCGLDHDDLFAFVLP